MTSDLSGADLANLVSGAVLVASRHGKEAVKVVYFDEVFERFVAGADIQANFLSQQFGLDARVSLETATLVDGETRRIVEEAMGEGGSIHAAGILDQTIEESGR